ncbi:D-isomer specific 2-hydroxyacid dehydrogenase, catalytic domain-containing protein [Cynara cardunculus var. scolymus]|uniref:D-isomer specific 2-hydroxyacid dehydrogenase, catalytic domain-containing protein n=1 Tax=Cynara cardunculus var. scolymus TaxID=59895 RepID=A0A103XEB3_CYNCS|nr:D-isomer specific 2-hydroxyacid dehydrogenase, catalytic domain-containing protein [Cynara cardunculus var. scolymus]
MGKHDPSQKEKIADDLPSVLLLRQPFVFKVYERQFSEKFRFLKPWESSLPLHQFLSTHAASVQAAFFSAGRPITTDILQNLPELRFIMTSSAGLDHIDLNECKRRGIKVANAGSIFSEDVADTAVGLLIDVLRRVSAANWFVKAGLWQQKGDYPLGHKLGGKRVGVVGMGSIGLNVAKKLNTFGCIISYNSRKKKPHVTFPFYPNIQELAANCEIIIICCALMDQTRHMIDKNVMMALGKEGIIVNVARGAIINEKELVQCLLKGEIAGAGLDVFENEPNVPEELFHLDNVVMTPHNAVMTEESMNNLYEIVIGNLEAFFSNKPLIFEVVQDSGEHFGSKFLEIESWFQRCSSAFRYRDLVYDKKQ